MPWPYLVLFLLHLFLQVFVRCSVSLLSLCFVPIVQLSHGMTVLSLQKILKECRLVFFPTTGFDFLKGLTNPISISLSRSYTPCEGSTALLLMTYTANADQWTVESRSRKGLPSFSKPLSELEVIFTTAMTSIQRVYLNMGYIGENENFVEIEEFLINHYYSQNRSILQRVRLRDVDIL